MLCLETYTNYSTLTKNKNVAYCGSTIQQNYGEDTDKGFLVWDINSPVDFKSKVL